MVFAGVSCAAYVFVLLLFLLLSAQPNYLDAGKSAALGWSEVQCTGSDQDFSSSNASKRSQFAEHGRDEFRNGWVNVHCPLHHRVRRLGIH